MKRLRDEVYLNPQFKRPFGSSSSRGEPHVPQQTPSSGVTGIGGIVNGGSSGGATGAAVGSTQKLTTNDALSYLKQVKDMFQDQRDKYDCFLDVMKDFKAQRIDTAGVIARVKELFKGHPNLILGFNTFLPKDYEITLSDDEEAPPKRTVEFDEAISFVNKIKKRFQNDDHVYKSFLDILNMYRKEHKSITEVYGEVATLFNDHPDLLDEFTRFLPDTSSSAAPSHGSLSRHSFNRYDDRSSPLPTVRQSQVDKQRQWKDRIVDPTGERDFSVERPDIEEDKTIIKKEHKKHTDRETRDRINRDLDDPDNGNGDIGMHRVSEKRKAARKVDDFGGTSNFTSYEDKGALKSIYSHEFLFCEKVKERLHSADDYQAFLKCLHLYSTEIINRQELQGLVGTLFGKYPDLLDGFTEFLERCERIDGFLPGVMGKKSSWNEGNSSKALRIDDKEKEQRREVEGAKDKERFNSKYFGKSIQELDLSNCERCTPSYRLLPDDYPIFSASQRTELGNEVLNDKWVSVTSGSEDYSFKNMRKNQYEESLFRCEDDRFELDMLLESVSSTAKRVEELLNSITDNLIGSEGPLRIEDHLSALNIRCIERLYGDHGLDVVDILRKNTPVALPVILTRLKQKQEEWTKCRSEFNKVWAEIYEKNHYKSLDHRSFYFKQQDLKNLSTKSLVVEIKEVYEKMQKEDDVLRSIAAGNRHYLSPNIEFKYADADVHDDVFRIIKYSCEELCPTKDQQHTVLRFWTGFLEPMLGVHPRPYGTDATGDDASKHKLIKTHSAGMLESDHSPTGDATVTNSKEVRSAYNNDSVASPRHANIDAGLISMDGAAKDGPYVTSGERATNNDTSIAFRPDVNPVSVSSLSRVSNGPVEGADKSKCAAEDKISSEEEENLKLNQQENCALGEMSGHSECKDKCADPSTAEKEEGELSPAGDFEDNFASYQHGSLTMKNGISENMPARMGINEEISSDAAGENDMDGVDDDSENISEGGEDVSGSESAADECSREEHEEEGDDDLDGKAESEGEADVTIDSHYIGGDGSSPPLSEQPLLTCKPLSKYVSSQFSSDAAKESRVLYGNDAFYVLLRLHQTLYERILSAKLNSVSTESKRRMPKDMSSSDPYGRFIDALFSLLDGSSDNAKFEDDCRSIIGNQSYVLFTLDKLIYKLVKQLQVVSSDEVCCKLLQLFEYENSRKPQKYVDLVHYENVHVLLHDENVYRFECTYNPTRLSIQLMKDANERSEVVAVSVDPSFASYLHQDYLSDNHGRKESSAIVLKRNIQKFRDPNESDGFRKATETARIMNGLECKMSSSTSKISYVLDTEDFFFRPGRRKDETACTKSKKAKSQRFNRLLEAASSSAAATAS